MAKALLAGLLLVAGTRVVDRRVRAGPPARQAVPRGDDLHRHPGHRAERRRLGAVVESITKPGAEIHDYQPTPLDIVRAQAADLVLWNGFNLERWFEKFFENVKEVPGVVVTEGVEPMGITRRAVYAASPTRMPGCRRPTR